MTCPLAWSFWYSIACRARRCPAVLALSISNARPLRHSTALTFLSLSCLLFVCLLGPNRSAPAAWTFSARAASARTPSDRHRRIGPPRLGPFAPISFGSPSLGRSPPLGPPLLPSARPHRIGVLGSGSLDRAPWLEPLQLSASPVPGWTRRVVVGPLRRFVARLHLSVLRAAACARSPLLQRSAALALSYLATYGHQSPMALDNTRASPAASLVLARSGPRPLWSMAASLLGCLSLGLVPLDQAPSSDIFQSALGCSVLGCPSTQLRWPLYVFILILTDARLRRSAAQALGLPTSRA